MVCIKFIGYNQSHYTPGPGKTNHGQNSTGKKRGPNAHKANTNSSEPTGIGRDKYTVSEFTGATGPCGKGKLIIHAK